MKRGRVVSNWSVKDDIREYWSKRAATFDLSPGHEIFTPQERTAWQALFRKHVGAGEGRKALDLASGTGVISRLIHEVGFSVTGLDFSDTMLARARKKASDLKLPLKFVSGDAENTLQPDETYDIVVTRHLVWTLPDPATALADWFRVLKPGGTLLVVDADMTRRTPYRQFMQRVAKFLKRFGPDTTTHGIDMATHERILKQVHFSGGAQPEAVVELARRAGFVDIVIDRDLKAVHRAQGLVMPLHQRIDRASQDRYAIRASKPLKPAGTDEAARGTTASRRAA